MSSADITRRVDPKVVLHVAEKLSAAIGSNRISTDPAVLAGYRHDQASWVDPGQPAVLARPVSTAEVADVLKIAAAHRLPVVPRGAGSGLSGGAAAVDLLRRWPVSSARSTALVCTNNEV